ncbi:MAG TPA: efflux RND transporter periplasmic adaptor subunit, partial [Pseudomonadales bacterium]|nr:efflux RND transporter periplasmic adaptor subunit [Pseudomonadales bacterium]
MSGKTMFSNYRENVKKKFTRPWAIISVAIALTFPVLLVSRNLHGLEQPVELKSSTENGREVADQRHFRLPEKATHDFKVAPVSHTAFCDEVVTEGYIAINEDNATPVYSPYSGRVSRLMVKLGDQVQKDAPLFSIAATEFVQGQNDLIDAVASATNARAQLKLAQATEKRQHELYDAKSGALKDWLQSQADLNSARNSVETSETAVATARNKLHILGMSAAEISATERLAKPIDNAETVVRAPI